MNNFLIKLGLFGISLGLLLAGVDFAITEGLKRSNYQDLPKWVEVSGGGIDAELIILGSSRALVHYDCEQISKKTGLSCYNLGLDGSNYRLQKEILKLYLRKNKNPERIVWSMDSHSLGEIDKYYGIENLAPFIQEPEIRRIIAIQDSNPEFLFYLPLIRYKFNPRFISIGLLSYLNLVKYKRRVINGYREMDIQWKGKTEESSYLEVEINSTYKIDFLELIHLIQSHSIQVSFVISPYFVNNNAKKQSLHKFDREIEAIEKELDVPKYSYIDSNLARTKDNFYDNSHMNKQGVSKWMMEFLDDYK